MGTREQAQVSRLWLAQGQDECFDHNSVAPAVGGRAQAAADRGEGAGMLHAGGGCCSSRSFSRRMAPGRTSPRQPHPGGCTRRHSETRGAEPYAWRRPRARCAAIRWVRSRRCCRPRGAPSRPLPPGCSRGTASSPGTLSLGGGPVKPDFTISTKVK